MPYRSESVAIRHTNITEHLGIYDNICSDQIIQKEQVGQQRIHLIAAKGGGVFRRHGAIDILIESGGIWPVNGYSPVGEFAVKQSTISDKLKCAPPLSIATMALSTMILIQWLTGLDCTLARHKSTAIGKDMLGKISELCLFQGRSDTWIQIIISMDQRR